MLKEERNSEKMKVRYKIVKVRIMFDCGGIFEECLLVDSSNSSC